VFQEITNTYGVPMYHEANPTVFSIVTFPFLFAVMFGDYGHGSLILVVGSFLTLFADRLKGTAMEGALALRYLFLMMGFFACFTGLLYNEWFAIPNDWFGSCFVADQRECTSASTGNCNPVYYPGDCDAAIYAASGCAMECVYPFGVDPAWFLSPTLLTFTNNIKMKLSVILGVIHMSIGVVVKGANSVYFSKNLDLFFEVITGLIILLGLFGWMDLLIFAKWTYVMNPYSIDAGMQERISYAPSIITVMINNFLDGGNPGENP
jgi:V-type H+-transporting ATPase subunit a